MIKHASPTTTIPVPALISLVLLNCPTSAPLKPTSILAMTSPSVIIFLTFTLDAVTIARLSPVARKDNPSLVDKNKRKRIMHTTNKTITNMLAYQLPPMFVFFNIVNTVACFKRDIWLDHPITNRLTVYNPVLVMIPEIMDGTPIRVCKKAVI